MFRDLAIVVCAGNKHTCLRNFSRRCLGRLEGSWSTELAVLGCSHFVFIELVAACESWSLMHWHSYMDNGAHQSWNQRLRMQILNYRGM
jgi:hypothetical protein